MDLLALVDCENFYASCERIFRPDLKKVPIVVLSNNDGCVGGSNAYPITFEPSNFNQSDNHDP